MAVDEVVVGREEILLVTRVGPRGDADRRHRTSQHHIALQLGPVLRSAGSTMRYPGATPCRHPATQIVVR